MGQDIHSSDRRRRQRSQSLPSKIPYLGPGGLNGVPVRCQYCSGQSFRRSTLRAEDFTQLLLMRYPVRCLRCSQRQGVSFTVAGISLSSKDKPKRPARNTSGPTAWIEPAEPAAPPDLRNT